MPKHVSWVHKRVQTNPGRNLKAIAAVIIIIIISGIYIALFMIPKDALHVWGRERWGGIKGDSFIIRNT